MLQINPKPSACRSLSSKCILDGFKRYLSYKKQAPEKKRRPSAVLITPILRRQITIAGFFILNHHP
jgi:hypothetical protein